MGTEKKQRNTSKLQGRPAHQKSESASVNEELQAKQKAQEAWEAQATEDESREDQSDAELDTSLSQATRADSAFSMLLGFLLKNERNEILRVAKEIGVSENTVYRWLNGTAIPRSKHMQRLLEVLPQSLLAFFASSSQLAYQSSWSSVGTQVQNWDIPRDLYRRVLELASRTVDGANRCGRIVETIFEHGLLFFDPDHHGIALTYTRLMPPRADGYIHSLYEAEMRGQAPWPFTFEFKLYLGSTTLAGMAAMSQRTLTWSASEPDSRILVALDEHECSACAAPVMRGGRMAGVLIVSSTQETFVQNPSVALMVSDYANLLATSLPDSDFYDTQALKLVPMPDLSWQRQQVSQTYLNRVIEYARKQRLTFPEAQRTVLQEMEEEFELYASKERRQTAQKPSKQAKKPR